jgi:hypothetical protein
MKWILTSSKQATIREYQLMDENSSKVVAKINPLHKSVRISCDNQHRLFFVEQVSSFAGKYIYHNEYGMEVGCMTTDKLVKSDGIILLDERKYFYRQQNNPLPGLLIYERGKFQPLFDCSLQPNSPSADIAGEVNEIDNKYLLLGLCWFANLKATKEFAH